MECRKDHPAQLCWGFVVEVEEQARQLRDPVFAFLADCARPAVLTVRELFSEISREAGEIVMLGDEYAADGKITKSEWMALRRRAVEMETEARDGRVL